MNKKMNSISSNHPFQILPWQTEKSLNSGAYVFLVPEAVNKVMVSQFVKSTFGVAAKKVTMARTHRKIYRRGRSITERPGKKKAYVILPKGKSIDLSALAGKPASNDNA